MPTKYKICDEPGPCWNGYVYVGPKVKAKKSDQTLENPKKYTPGQKYPPKHFRV